VTFNIFSDLSRNPFQTCQITFNFNARCVIYEFEEIVFIACLQMIGILFMNEIKFAQVRDFFDEINKDEVICR